MSRLDEFLSGDRPDDVAIYLADRIVNDPDRLASVGERVEDGVLLLVDGERGRAVFQSATGIGAMEFAGAAMSRDGTIDRTLAGGICPERDDGPADLDESTSHELRFLLAFVEKRDDEVGGQYAEGDVVHAYAACDCGTAYSETWIVEN